MSIFDKLIDRSNTDSIAWSRFKDALPLWVADMDFECPPEIVEAIKARTDFRIYGYGDSYPALREAFAIRQADLFGWKLETEQVKATAGILPIFYFLICALTKPDDSVLLFTPAYPPFFKLIRQSGRELIESELLEKREGQILSYEIDFDNLEKIVKPSTKVMVLCSPHNPVGKIFTKKELEKIADFCLRRGIKIISDEIHAELTFNAQHIPTASLANEVSEITLTLSGPTKTFNLPGLKVGHLIIQNEKLRSEIFEAASEAVADVSVLSAVAALAAYQKCDYWKKELIEYIKANRECSEKFLKENFPEAKFTSPQSTYLTWVDMQAYANSKSPFELALKNKVAVGYGKNFGKQFENYIRVSLACPRAMLKDGLDRLKNGFFNSY